MITKILIKKIIDRFMDLEAEGFSPVQSINAIHKELIEEDKKKADSFGFAQESKPQVHTDYDTNDEIGHGS